MKKINFTLLITALMGQISFAAQPILNVKHWQTHSGARVYFIQEKTVPMLDIMVVFDAGSARDEKHHGLAALTNDLLIAGTEKQSENEVVKSLEEIGAEYNNAIDRDMAVVSLRTLVEPQKMESAVRTFSDILQTPKFLDQAFDRLRNEQLDMIRSLQQSPGSIASIVFYETLYGTHPYAHPIYGTLESVSELTRSDAVAFYKNYYVAKNELISMVGDITESQARNIAEQLTQNMPAGTKPAPIPPVEALTHSVTKKIAYPSKQTHIVIGGLGVSYKNPHYFPLLVGNNILGGAPMISRLFDQVREQRGLSYGVDSGFNRMQQRGPFMINLQSKNQSAAEALQLSDNILQDFLKQGPTINELEFSKKNLEGGFPLKIHNNNALLQLMTYIAYYGLPLNYLDTYEKNVQAVTADQIRIAFQKTIDPKMMVTVIVGDPTSIKQTAENNHAKRTP